ncbi:hypothetical protein PSA7680_00667 [Pseudoruegeria aquimaris]|uniref:TfoX N-terminal domain-containing protein n=1 Tax=Pseudoruegeria aquimaris TaxID=393663 RepID=A0A1Y5RKU3_9RHOB|nr:TfoX/Sxy family protein [Pseudoruegeria aquimaris]SLN18877.1 hypothetical protein PSA7680_00667 [Pseudoruegeria aquimaris]
MAYDEGLAQLMRDELAGQSGITEKKMFGGLCFLLNGNMVCGVHAGGAMFRVGKAREAEALAIPGAAPLSFTGRPLGGMIETDAAALGDDGRRGLWMALALAHASALPPK